MNGKSSALCEIFLLVRQPIDPQPLCSQFQAPTCGAGIEVAGSSHANIVCGRRHQVAFNRFPRHQIAERVQKEEDDRNGYRREHGRCE